MITFAPFKAEHLMDMPLQPEQEWVQQAGVEGLRVLEHGSYAQTAFEDGVPIAACGVIPQWEGRGIAWAYLRRGIKPHAMAVAVRWGKRWLDVTPYRRLEAAVEIGYEQGHRLVRLLGFGEPETPLARKYLPSGADAALYALVRD